MGGKGADYDTNTDKGGVSGGGIQPGGLVMED